MVRIPHEQGALRAGLYHPRCKDSHTTYFPGISNGGRYLSEKELEDIGQANQQEAERKYASRQVEKYGRLAEYSLSPENQKQYKQKLRNGRGRRRDTRFQMR